MGLFVSNKTVKIYFDDEGKIVDKETENWIEVYKELSVSALKKLQNSWKPKIEYKDGEQVMLFEDIEVLPVEFLAEVIVRWSEKDTPTVENIKSKLRHDIAQNLYNKLNEMYNLQK